MRYSAITPQARAEMLAALDAPDVEYLLRSIPASVRMKRPLEIEGPWPEADLKRRLEALKGSRPRIDFTGAGLYQHYIPDTVHSLCARSEWVTSYTPYQAETSQGTLVMYYEFQSYIAMLTGQEIANGGMYDGSTAMVEAALMAKRVRPKADPVIYVSQAVHPEYRAVLETYMSVIDVEVVELTYDPMSGTTLTTIGAEEQKNAIAVILQSPNYFGVVEDFSELDDAFRIWVCSEAMSLAHLPPPPCEIAVGECQSFGIPVQLGGPTAGYFATKKAWVRKTPGRLVGRTVDEAGNEAYCITLATREQFIRREKATSNICTSSGLMCLRATVYLSLLGRKGLEELALKNAKTARFFAAGFEKMGLRVAFDGPTFNEFVLDLSAKPGLHEALLERDIVLGVPLGPDYDGLENHYVLASTELHYAEAGEFLEEIESVAKEL